MRAVEFWQNPDCAAIFNLSGNGFDPATLLGDMVNSPSFDFIPGAPGNQLNVLVFTAAHVLPIVDVSQNANGQNIATVIGAHLTINTNSASPFNTGGADFQAITLLHELGHAFGIIPGAGGSVVYNPDPGGISALNTYMVQEACLN